MLPEVLSEDPIHRIPWHGQATIGANGRLIVEDHVLSAHLFGLSPLLSLAEKILVRLVAFPPAAMSIPFLAPPPEADAQCLTLRSNLGPETSAHPDLSEWLERQTNTASVIGSLLLCLSDTTLSGENRRLLYTSHHSSYC